MNKILVVGATGNIGSFVVQKLKEKGSDFTALVRTDEKAKKLNEKGISTVVGDLSAPASLSKALENVNKVFLVSTTSPNAPVLQGNLVDAAREKGVDHIVKVSSLGTDLHSPIGIARFHAQVEEHIKKSGISYTFLHPHSFMQNLIFDRETIRDQSAIYAQMGEGKINMVDARDIAAVAVKALTGTGHEGKTYILTGPGSFSYWELADIFSEVLGKEVRYVPVTSVDARSSMLESGMPGWLVEDLVALNTGFSQGTGDVQSPDVEGVTGNAPHSVRDFIEAYKDEFV